MTSIHDRLKIDPIDQYTAIDHRGIDDEIQRDVCVVIKKQINVFYV